MNWLACRCTTGKEYEMRAKLRIIDEKAEIYIPRKNYKEVKSGVIKKKSEKMLPGYILIGSENPLNGDKIGDFFQVVGVVTEEEIAQLRAQEGQKEGNLEVGSRILVIDGPLQGSKGHILNKEGEDCKCKIVFQGCELDVKLREDYISILS